MRRGDSGRLEELLDPAAPAAFRDAQASLLFAFSQRPAATFVERTVLATRTRLGLLEAEVLERDDQGRARQRRAWFSGPLDALRQTEPALAELGTERVETAGPFRFVYRELDAPQLVVAKTLGEKWLGTYASRLGGAYAARRTIEVRFAPTQETWPEGLPAVASAAVARGVFYVLSSSAMLASDGDAGRLADVVVGHELAHVLLDGRGARGGGFLLNEGLPLWLTDDRREPELARLVGRGEIWDLPHLLAGPADESEFFAAYAQASSFVRYVAERFGERAPIALWGAASVPSFDRAARDALGVGGAELHADWRRVVLATTPAPAPGPPPDVFELALPL